MKALKCEEAVYVADFKGESHYWRYHEKNWNKPRGKKGAKAGEGKNGETGEKVEHGDKSENSEKVEKVERGWEVAGKIIADMTFLKTEGLIKKIPPPTGYGKSYYKVEYELVMIVEGLNLKYEARWPIGGQEARGQGQISIAAAFVPGTS